VFFFVTPLPTTMVQPGMVAVVASKTTPRIRTRSSGSFHAGAPIPTLASIRSAASHRPGSNRQSSQGYLTFPTQPPQTPRGPPERPGSSSSAVSSGSSSMSSHSPEQTPLPVRQLALLAVLSLSEQTALNSIGPYLPSMIASFPEIPDGKAGLYIGLLASAFALAQLSTNFFWGYLSDVIGRKPVMLMGTFLLMCCFSLFGLCTTYLQVIIVHVAMGLLNGNAAVVPTVLGEVTDRSNQSIAFTWLPVIYSLGGITGPALGGLLVGVMGKTYPYLAPNLVGAILLLISVVVIGIWFEETLDEADQSHLDFGFLQRALSHIWSYIWSKEEPRRNSWSSRWPRRESQPLLSPSTSDSDPEGTEIGDADREHEDVRGDEDGKHKPERRQWREIFNRTTVMLLISYLVFQLSNISFNSLYPIFAAASPPTGRDLSPETIGLSLSFAGVATIIFQAFLFQPLKARLGNLGSYRFALLGLAISMALAPWIGYRDSKPPLGIGSGEIWLYVELGFVLVIKSVCAIGGLSCVMLLVSCLLYCQTPPFHLF
jgi:MFS family permease